MRGNSIDKTITMNRDFLIDILDFLMNNLDSIIMMTIIIFLVFSWTWVLEWKIPKKNVIFKKNIGIEVSEWVETKKTGHLVDAYGNKLDRFGNKLKGVGHKLTGNFFEPFKSKDDGDSYEKNCGTDELCLDHNLCIGSNDCKSEKKCCEVKYGSNIKCVGGNKEGPTYDKDNFDEWWYLGNNYRKN